MQPARYAACVAACIVVLVAAALGEEWPGTVLLKQTAIEDYKWSVIPEIINSDRRVARGFLLEIRLIHQASRSLTFEDQTGVHIDSSMQERGIWTIRARTASPTDQTAVHFGLSGNGATWTKNSFAILFAGPLYGKCTALDWLQATVTLFGEVCDQTSCPMTCGDGQCLGAETCASCPTDCLSVATCAPICGDGICSSAQESHDDCPTDCVLDHCTKPFTSIFGWGLTTTLMVGGVVFSILFAFLSGMLFKYRNEKKQLMSDDEPQVPQNTLRKINDVHIYEESDDHVPHIDSPVKLPVPSANVNNFTEMEESIERVAIESKPHAFRDKPWANLVPESPSSVQVQFNYAASERHEPVGSDTPEATFRPPRVPGYLQDLPQHDLQPMQPRRPSSQDRASPQQQMTPRRPGPTIRRRTSSKSTDEFDDALSYITGTQPTIP